MTARSVLRHSQSTASGGLLTGFRAGMLDSRDRKPKKGQDMKKLLLAAASLGAVVSTPALAAPTGSATYQVSASVAPTCNVGAGGTIAFGSLNLNDDGTVATGQNKSSGTQAVYCNAASTLTISANNTISNGTAPADGGGFTKTLTFTTTAQIGSGSTLNEGANSVGPVAGDLVVTASAINGSGGARPYAGSYTGSLTVTLAPNS